MRVYVYAAVTHLKASVHWTAAPAIDMFFWLSNDPAWPCKEKGAVQCLIWWPELVPLGDAEFIVSCWEQEGLQAQYTATVTSAVKVKMSRLMSRLNPAYSLRGRPLVEMRSSPARGDLYINCGDAITLMKQANRLAELLAGRALLIEEVKSMLTTYQPPAQWTASNLMPPLQLAALLGRIQLQGALGETPLSFLQRGFGWISGKAGRPAARRLKCRRCGSGEEQMRRTYCAACQSECLYCESCLTMGRCRACSLLIIGTPGAEGERRKAAAANGGKKPDAGKAAMAAKLAPWQLSDAQAAAAAAALRFMAAPRAEKRQFLLWAVTGAGKTEMMFPLVAACLEQGGRALIATPRRDVVLELDPRLRKAFPSETVVTLYGGSEQRWGAGGITLATTHQLFRFQHAFELVVIDELDAFPYHGDERLYYAADKVCMPAGITVLLSATPPAALQRAAKRGRLAHVRVPVRFHRHPLPEPGYLKLPAVRNIIGQRQIPSKLTEIIKGSLLRGAQLFIFVQRINQIVPLVALLKQAFPDAPVAGTSSKDKERTDKVKAFRQRHFRILVTTTILERGVTVPKSDVMILDADAKLFDAASLVQMAGRAGRSKDDPAGRVYYCAPVFNRAQRLAIRQIKEMNRIARVKGYLHAGGRGNKGGAV